MRRFLVYFIKLGLLAALAAFLATHPGRVHIDWQDWQIDTSAAVLTALAFLLLILWMSIYRLIVAMREIASRHKTRKAIRRHEHAENAMLAGLNALAASDARSAKKAARLVAGFLGEEHPLSLWLMAQASQMSGDTRLARKNYESLIQRVGAEALGSRGLIAIARQEGQTVSLPPSLQAAAGNSPWAVALRFDTATRSGDYAEAGRLLPSMLRNDLFHKDSGRARRLESVVRVEQSRTTSNKQEMLFYAQKARKLTPDFAPALVALAQAYLANGDRKNAIKAILRGWTQAAHPALFALYRHILTDEPALKNLTQFEHAIGKVAAQDRETHLALGTLALAADLWGKAQGHAMTALAIRPGARAYHLLADIVRRENPNDPGAVSRWLEMALVAPQESSWHCSECGAHQQEWDSHCKSCNAFATLNWRAH